MHCLSDLGNSKDALIERETPALLRRTQDCPCELGGVLVQKKNLELEVRVYHDKRNQELLAVQSFCNNRRSGYLDTEVPSTVPSRKKKTVGSVRVRHYWQNFIRIHFCIIISHNDAFRSDPPPVPTSINAYWPPIGGSFSRWRGGTAVTVQGVHNRSYVLSPEAIYVITIPPTAYRQLLQELEQYAQNHRVSMDKVLTECLQPINLFERYPRLYALFDISQRLFENILRCTNTPDDCIRYFCSELERECGVIIKYKLGPFLPDLQNDACLRIPAKQRNVRSRNGNHP